MPYLQLKRIAIIICALGTTAAIIGNDRSEESPDIREYIVVIIHQWNDQRFNILQLTSSKSATKVTPTWMNVSSSPYRIFGHIWRMEFLSCLYHPLTLCWCQTSRSSSKRVPSNWIRCSQTCISMVVHSIICEACESIRARTDSVWKFGFHNYIWPLITTSAADYWCCHWKEWESVKGISVS